MGATWELSTTVNDESHCRPVDKGVNMIQSVWVIGNKIIVVLKLEDHEIKLTLTAEDLIRYAS